MISDDFKNVHRTMRSYFSVRFKPEPANIDQTSLITRDDFTTKPYRYAACLIIKSRDTLQSNNQDNRSMHIVS